MDRCIHCRRPIERERNLGGNEFTYPFTRDKAHVECVSFPSAERTAELLETRQGAK